MIEKKEVHFKEINEENLDDVIDLYDTLTLYQKDCVASNIYSLAQAYVHKDYAWPKAIYADETLIGFIMLDLKALDVPKEYQPAYYLWRFMIAKDHQAKGYGKTVLDLVVKKCKQENIKFLYTSCEIKEPQPYNFYIKYGFVDTHVFEDGEQVLRYEVKNQKI